MIVTILGLPGRLTEFCRDVCVDILARVGRVPFAESVSTLNSFARMALQAGDRAGIAVATEPDRLFIEALREAGRPVLLVLDDPRRAVLELCGSGTSPRDAILVVTGSCATVSDALGFEAAIRVTHEVIGADLAAFARNIVAFLALPESDETLAIAGEVVAHHLPRIVTEPGEPDVSARLDAEIGPVWGLAVRAAVGGFWTSFFEGKIGKLIAARELFFSADTNALLTGLIDATGRPRIVAYGPYLRIPRGQWTLRMTLAFSPELVGTPFSLDVARFDGRTNVELGRVSFSAISGKYVAQTTFAHDEPGLGLEFRLFIDKATFDGQVAIGFAELERLDDGDRPDLGAVADFSITA